MTAVKVDGRLLVDWQATIRTHLPMVGRYVPDAMPAMREMLGVLESAVWGDLPIAVEHLAHWRLILGKAAADTEVGFLKAALTSVADQITAVLGHDEAVA